MNNDKNQKFYLQYAELAKKEKSVIFGGRLAEYKYYDMDDVIKSALDLAGKILLVCNSVSMIKRAVLMAGLDYIHMD